MYIFNRIFNRLVNKVCFSLMIIIIALLFFFIGIWSAKASTYVDIKNYQLPTAFTPYNCSSSTTCTTVLASDYSQLLNVDRYAYILQNPTTIGTSGLNMTFQVDQTLTKGYLYSMSTLYCSNVSNVTATLYSGSSSSSSKFNSMKYSDTVSTSVSAFDVMYSTESASYSAGEDNEYCYIINSVFSPNTNGQWVSLHLQRSSLSGTSLHYLYGYQLENLGVYSESLVDDISSIINESNNKTQESIDNMNEEIKETLNDNFNTCRDSLNKLSFDNRTIEENGLTFKISDNVFTIKGTATSWTQSFYNPLQISLDSTHTFSTSLSGTCGGISPKLAYTYQNSSFYPTVHNSNLTLNSGTYLIQSYFIVDSGVNVDCTIKMQLQEGTRASDWEKPNTKICKNKIDETNDKLDDTNEKLDDLNETQKETNDLIKDDNVDGASSTGNSFFDDFNTKDNGGISSVITMPLRLINGLLDENNTCSTLKMTIFNKEVEIPSGCMLWDLAPDSVVTIWRTFVCGASAYFLLTSLFKDIEKLKNPNNSEVSTLDL